MPVRHPATLLLVRRFALNSRDGIRKSLSKHIYKHLQMHIEIRVKILFAAVSILPPNSTDVESNPFPHERLSCMNPSSKSSSISHKRLTPHRAGRQRPMTRAYIAVMKVHRGRDRTLADQSETAVMFARRGPAS